MKVNGITIEQEVIDAAIARMRADGFKASEIEALIKREAGLRSSEVANRAADRIIQRSVGPEDCCCDCVVGWRVHGVGPKSSHAQ